MACGQRNLAKSADKPRFPLNGILLRGMGEIFPVNNFSLKTIPACGKI
jgi:hypothetical protein